MNEHDLRANLYDPKPSLLKPPETAHKAHYGSAAAAAMVVLVMLFLAPWMGWEAPSQQEAQSALHTIINYLIMALAAGVPTWIAVYRTPNKEKEHE